MAKTPTREAAARPGGDADQAAELRSLPKHAARPAPETIRIEALKAAIEMRVGSSNADSIIRAAAQYENWIASGSTKSGEDGA